MKYIFRYENYNESKGISDSSEKLTNFIWDIIESDVIEGHDTKRTISFEEMDLNINNLFLSINIRKSSENTCNAVTKLRDAKIEEGYLVGAEMMLTISYSNLEDAFLYYIKSVIFHEVIHLFQFFNIKAKNKFRPESFSIGSIIPQIRPRIKTDYVNYILDIIYHSLSHELSAQLHQYYMYKRAGKSYTKLDDIKRMISSFDIKELSEDEDKGLSFLKKHIVESIRYFTTNKKYEKDISNSIWTLDNTSFLTKLKLLLDSKIKWLNKKIKMIDSKVEINYSETFTFYGNLEDFEYLDCYNYIIENLNDCPIISNI